MTNEWNKYFSNGTTFVFLIILALLAAGAMFFPDDGGSIGSVFGQNKPKFTQAMELRGKWLGMNLTALDSPTAHTWGVPPSLKGVMVVEIGEKSGWRANMAGVIQGDVIVAVDGKNIRDLADLYDISRTLDVGSSLLLDIRRWGQPMTLVLPALYSVPPAVVPPQIQQAGQPVPMVVQRANGGAVQPVALMPVAQGMQFYCPKHNRVWPQNAVQPNYRCPLGNCLLNRMR